MPASEHSRHQLLLTVEHRQHLLLAIERDLVHTREWSLMKSDVIGVIELLAPVSITIGSSLLLDDA
jgi:hypothetical protein